MSLELAMAGVWLLGVAFSMGFCVGEGGSWWRERVVWLSLALWPLAWVLALIREARRRRRRRWDA